MGKQKDKIIPLLKQGLTYKQISELTGAAKSTISYHAQKLTLPERPTKKLGRRRKYDWAEIRSYYEDGHTLRDCMDKFGFYAGTWDKAVKRGDIVPKSHAVPLKEVMTKDSPYTRGSLKIRLIKAGVLEERCYECGHEGTWTGKPIVYVLDHINGVHNDHRLENLQMLCPNCNSQTDTFAGRNKKYK